MASCAVRDYALAVHILGVGGVGVILPRGSAGRQFTHLFKVIIIIFPHGLGRLTCSGIDALPSFPRASKISSFSMFLVEGMFRKSGVVRSFGMVDPVLFVLGSYVLYSRDL